MGGTFSPRATAPASGGTGQTDTPAPGPMGHQEVPVSDTTTFRTVTLIGRPPVKLVEADWPEIAKGDYDAWNGEVRAQANRKWAGWIRVRRHADGRTLVYGRADYDTAWRGEESYCYHGGELLAPGEDPVAAIHRVAADLIERGADERMTEAAHECVGNLPAEAI